MTILALGPKSSFFLNIVSSCEKGRTLPHINQMILLCVCVGGGGRDMEKYIFEHLTNHFDLSLLVLRMEVLKNAFGITLLHNVESSTLHQIWCLPHSGKHASSSAEA